MPRHVTKCNTCICVSRSVSPYFGASILGITVKNMALGHNVIDLEGLCNEKQKNEDMVDVTYCHKCANQSFTGCHLFACKFFSQYRSCDNIQGLSRVYHLPAAHAQIRRTNKLPGDSFPELPSILFSSPSLYYSEPSLSW